jgi:hypothetical protein
VATQGSGIKKGAVLKDEQVWNFKYFGMCILREERSSIFFRRVGETFEATDSTGTQYKL